MARPKSKRQLKQELQAAILEQDHKSAAAVIDGVSAALQEIANHVPLSCTTISAGLLMLWAQIQVVHSQENDAEYSRLVLAALDNARRRLQEDGLKPKPKPVAMRLM